MCRRLSQSFVFFLKIFFFFCLFLFSRNLQLLDQLTLSFITEKEFCVSRFYRVPYLTYHQQVKTSLCLPSCRGPLGLGPDGNLAIHDAMAVLAFSYIPGYARWLSPSKQPPGTALPTLDKMTTETTSTTKITRLHRYPIPRRTLAFKKLFLCWKLMLVWSERRIDCMSGGVYIEHQMLGKLEHETDGWWQDVQL